MTDKIRDAVDALAQAIREAIVDQMGKNPPELAQAITKTMVGGEVQFQTAPAVEPEAKPITRSSRRRSAVAGSGTPEVPEAPKVELPDAVDKALSGETEAKEPEQPTGRRRRRSSSASTNDMISQDTKVVTGKTFKDSVDVNFDGAYKNCKFKGLDLSGINIQGTFTNCEFVACVSDNEHPVSITGVLKDVKFEECTMLLKSVDGVWTRVSIVDSGLEGFYGAEAIEVDAKFHAEGCTIDDSSIFDVPEDSFSKIFQGDDQAPHAR